MRKWQVRSPTGVTPEQRLRTTERASSVIPSWPGSVFLVLFWRVFNNRFDISRDTSQIPALTPAQAGNPTTVPVVASRSQSGYQKPYTSKTLYVQKQNVIIQKNENVYSEKVRQLARQRSEPSRGPHSSPIKWRVQNG